MHTKEGGYDDVAAATTAGIVVVETEGSRWEFWEIEHLYRRSPRTEASRENPAWGGPEAGPLQDHVWHPFADWFVGPDWLSQRLRIVLPDGSAIGAPNASLSTGAAHSCAACSTDSDDATVESQKDTHDD